MMVNMKKSKITFLMLSTDLSCKARILLSAIVILSYNKIRFFIYTNAKKKKNWVRRGKVRNKVNSFDSHSLLGLIFGNTYGF